MPSATNINAYVKPTNPVGATHIKLIMHRVVLEGNINDTEPTMLKRQHGYISSGGSWCLSRAQQKGYATEHVAAAQKHRVSHSQLSHFSLRD